MELNDFLLGCSSIMLSIVQRSRSDLRAMWMNRKRCLYKTNKEGPWEYFSFILMDLCFQHFSFNPTISYIDHWSDAFFPEVIYWYKAEPCVPDHLTHTHQCVTVSSNECCICLVIFMHRATRTLTSQFKCISLMCCLLKDAV